jgi:hypothetical protein
MTVQGVGSARVQAGAEAGIQAAREGQAASSTRSFDPFQEHSSAKHHHPTHRRPGRRARQRVVPAWTVELRFGDSALLIAAEFPEQGTASPLALGGTDGTPRGRCLRRACGGWPAECAPHRRHGRRRREEHGRRRREERCPHLLAPPRPRSRKISSATTPRPISSPASGHRSMAEISTTAHTDSLASRADTRCWRGVGREFLSRQRGFSERTSASRQ